MAVSCTLSVVMSLFRHVLEMESVIQNLMLFSVTGSVFMVLILLEAM